MCCAVRSSGPQDALLARHVAPIAAAVAALPRLADALALLRGWARQHGFAQQPGGITGFHLTMLAAHLHSRSALVRLPVAADRPSQHGLQATQCRRAGPPEPDYIRHQLQSPSCRLQMGFVLCNRFSYMQRMFCVPAAASTMAAAARTEVVEIVRSTLSGRSLRVGGRWAQSVAMTAPQLMRAVLAALAEPRTFAKGCVMARPSTTPTLGKAAGAAADASGSDSGIDDGGGGSEREGEGAGVSERAPLPPPPPAAAFRKQSATVFLDPTGWLNLTTDVSKSAMQHVRNSPLLTHLPSIHYSAMTQVPSAGVTPVRSRSNMPSSFRLSLCIGRFNVRLEDCSNHQLVSGRKVWSEAP